MNNAPRFFRLRWSLGILGIAAVACAPWVMSKFQNMWAREWHQYRPFPAASAAEAQLEQHFLSDAPAAERFDTLFRYFADGFVRHAAPGFSRVHYPGVGSTRGFRTDGLEGFARTAPLLAAWASAGHGASLPDPRGGPPLDINEMLKQGILQGTDPSSPDYWGDIHEVGQKLVEATEIARVLWLTRATLWTSLTSEQQARITRWFAPADQFKQLRNNWMLFPVIIDLTVAGLNGDSEASRALLAHATKMFAQYREFYLESGWFFDYPHGVDFYNTWGITYDLFWIHLIAPEFAGAFIRDTIAQSAKLTEHLISPLGVPIMGRSICYRTAVPVPVVAAELIGSPDASAGRSVRALDVVWRYFIAHKSVSDGALTQGYFGSDPRFVDKYSGAGSCHWGLRSLTLAFLHGPQDEFWQAAPEPLPIEVGSYTLSLPKLRWQVAGNQVSGEITIEILDNEPGVREIEPYTWFNRMVEQTFQRPYRPRNDAAKYESRIYSSARPFPLDKIPPAHSTLAGTGSPTVQRHPGVGPH